jgi:hypothetical protein
MFFSLKPHVAKGNVLFYLFTSPLHESDLANKGIKILSPILPVKWLYMMEAASGKYPSQPGVAIYYHTLRTAIRRETVKEGMP